ncbi:MAG: hypothetical protein PSV16_12420 [Flavobacterium sp.]|nr:hypothetical protein [Flavobacterium sp.]
MIARLEAKPKVRNKTNTSEKLPNKNPHKLTARFTGSVVLKKANMLAVFLMFDLF